MNIRRIAHVQGEEIELYGGQPNKQAADMLTKYDVGRMIWHGYTGAAGQLERAQFWTDLAAGMSHEIRNPLVAIKTFAQLLPERYADAEFRAEFSRLVAGEVDRLNGIIEQINAFAHPPALAVPRMTAVRNGA